MNVGQRIRQRREALNVTQQELAKALGVTPQHISVVEQDKRVPSLTFLAKLAEKLGVSIDYLVSGKVGKEGVVSAIDRILAIKADKTLTLKAKRGLIALVEELRATGE
jgi:transcriptional regulator with XRE-family HTH domain